MLRILVGALVLLGLAPPCRAFWVALPSLPELVAHADVIVVGTVTAAGDTRSVRVRRTLAGAVGPGVEFPRVLVPFREAPSRYDPLRPGDAGVFFLTAGPGGLALIYPPAPLATDRADEVARLVDMRANPAKYLAYAATAGSPELVETLGLAFAGRETVGGLGRPAAAAHLSTLLGSQDPQFLVGVLVALRRVGGRDAGAALPLLRHRDERVQLAALEFIAVAQDRAAVGPLCELLDGIKSYSKLEEPIGRALIAIGDPAAVPALERAVKRGAFRMSSVALGYLGDKQSFEVLMADVERDSRDALEGLMALVRRSNKRLEPWMGVNRLSEDGLEHKQDWRKWWDANKATFAIVKTAKEALPRGGGR